jgi:hypothetical protein
MANVPSVSRRAYECVGWCETPHGSSNGQPYCHLRLREPRPRPLQSRPGAQRLPLLSYFEGDTRKAPFHTNEDAEAAVRTQDTDLSTAVLESREAVGQMHKCRTGSMFKNSQLMPRSSSIGVYLVHAVSYRWRTRETYFPTIPRIKTNLGDKGKEGVEWIHVAQERNQCKWREYSWAE